MRWGIPSAEEAQYRRLWKRFYDTIEIKERRNPKLRMSNMPKWRAASGASRTAGKTYFCAGPG